MNPVKAKICKSLDEYSWSSHHSYKTKTNTSWLSTHYITEILSNHFSYREFMLKRNMKSLNPVFCELGENGDLIISNSVADHTQYTPCLTLDHVSLNTLTIVICDHMQIPLEKIASPSQAKRVSLARSMIAYFAHYHAHYTFADIAGILGRQPKSISKTLCRHLMLASHNREIRNTIDSLEHKLSISDVHRWSS